MRVGVPFRTRDEERRGERGKIEPYVVALREAGAEPVAISLGLGEEQLREKMDTLGAVLLPGSPADVNPARFGSARHEKCGPVDEDRDRTDFALLQHALGESKPVLAICYGIQSLNVFMGGSLVQDIASERASGVQHRWDRKGGATEPFHEIEIAADARLSSILGARIARVNSSHHQCIRDLGRGLRIAARASDGVIEAVEGAGEDWITGVQWHPERMAGTDAGAQALFREFCRAAERRLARQLPSTARDS